MVSTQNREIVLAERPHGMPTESTFQLREIPIPQPKDGELLIKTVYLSVDPYMRMRMNDTRGSYIAPFEVGKPMSGGVIGQVVESKHPDFQKGDYVLGFLNWQEYNLSDGEDLQKVNAELAPLSTYLGILGMPGMTSYFGMLDIGKPVQGETVVVSGAAGAVGTIAGQIAKLVGARVIGIAGSDEKVAYLKEQLGFDEAINYKDPNFAQKLVKACPKGVDVYFDNVGGDVTDEVMKQINWHARIVVCGQISSYNMDKPDIGPRHFRTLIVKSAMARGFVITGDYKDRMMEGVIQMAEWIRQGKIKYSENIIHGFENTPKAFIGLFKGENLGKQLVKT